VHSGRILIAIANRSLLASYCDVLLNDGYVVAAATDGISCLSLLHGSMPQLAIIDRALPWGGGDGVIAVMRQKWRSVRVPVIALTTRDDDALRTFSAFPGDTYFSTPPTPESLTTTVRTLLHEQHSNLRADPTAGQGVRPGRVHVGEPREVPWTIQANKNHSVDFREDS